LSLRNSYAVFLLVNVRIIFLSRGIISFISNLLNNMIQVAYVAYNAYICGVVVRLQEIINLLLNILVSFTELNYELNQVFLLL
jgi:hypothetical protein